MCSESLTVTVLCIIAMEYGKYNSAWASEQNTEICKIQKACCGTAECTLVNHCPLKSIDLLSSRYRSHQPGIHMILLLLLRQHLVSIFCQYLQNSNFDCEWQGIYWSWLWYKILEMMILVAIMRKSWWKWTTKWTYISLIVCSYWKRAAKHLGLAKM